MDWVLLVASQGGLVVASYSFDTLALSEVEATLLLLELPEEAHVLAFEVGSARGPGLTESLLLREVEFGLDGGAGLSALEVAVDLRHVGCLRVHPYLALVHDLESFFMRSVVERGRDDGGAPVVVEL